MGQGSAAASPSKAIDKLWSLGRADRHESPAQILQSRPTASEARVVLRHFKIVFSAGVGVGNYLNSAVLQHL